MGHRIWLCFVGLVVGAGLLAAAGLSAAAQQKGGTLRIASVHDVDSLDPAIAYGTDSWMVEFATCARLYNYPDEPGSAGSQVIPEVATALPGLSKDGKTQTVRLKRTFRFHTGARITAANFVAAFNRDADPNLKSPVVSVGYLHEIVGADEVIDGKADTISGIRALGPYTLQIRTTRPLPELVSLLAIPFFCPVSTSAPRVESGDPLGSGPYYVSSHLPNRQIVLQRNRFYRGSRPANVDRVVWSIGLAPEACRQAVELDELDWCLFTPPEDYRQIAARYGINRPNGRFFFNPTLTINYFAFNHDRPAFRARARFRSSRRSTWSSTATHSRRRRGTSAGGASIRSFPPRWRGTRASIRSGASQNRASRRRGRSSPRPDTGPRRWSSTHMSPDFWA